jgi:acyl carrier protein
MSRDQVVQILRDRAVELFEIAPEAMVEEASFADDLGLDSLSVVEYLVVLEESFGVELMETAPADVRTVGALADLVLEKQAR